MDSSDEDVYVGPLTLSDVKTILIKMDPFRKVAAVNDSLDDWINVNQVNDSVEKCINETLNDSSSEKSLPDASILVSSNQDLKNEVFVHNSSEGSGYGVCSYIKSDETLSDSALIDPLLLSPDEILNSGNNALNITTHEIIINEKRLKGDEAIAALERSMFNNAYNTQDWVGLVNNITNSHNIVDQTEPEYLLQHTMDHTIVPDNRTFKHKKCDLTILEQPQWLDESVSSFEAMEQLTRSPTSTVGKEVMKHHNSSDSSYITSVYETAQGSSFEASPQSYFARDVFRTPQNTSANSKPNKTSPDEVNNTLDFDNTFEEMKYYLDLGTKLKDNNKPKTPQQTKPVGCPYPSFSPVTPTDSASETASPLSARRSRKEGFYARDSPLKSLYSNSEFRIPKTPTSSITKNLSKSPLYNYDHIVSPISMYIKNTPRVPLLGTHTPAMNAGIQRKKMLGTDVTTNEKYKENIEMGSPHSLPTKAYKSSAYNTVTTLKSPCVLTSLTKNDKIKKLISITPAHQVIRHDGRLKESKLPRFKITKPEDSFADLSVSSADISILVKKEATRSETILKKPLP